MDSTAKTTVNMSIGGQKLSMSVDTPSGMLARIGLTERS